jgi:hypothetical protein
MLIQTSLISAALHVLWAAVAESSDARIDWASLHCPKNNVSTLPTPTYGTHGRVWMICTELVIDAPPQKVYDTLIDFRSYHLWNSFVVDVQLPPDVTTTPDDVYEGMEMVFTTTGLIPGVNTTSDEVLTVLQDDAGEGYILNAWRSNVFHNGSLSRAEHPNILTSAEGGTRYVSYETYYEGLATPLIETLKPQLQAAFDRQGADLKAYLEG